MDQESLDKIISLLETAEEFYVPVKKLWKELRQDGFALPEYDAFVEELGKDERFEIGIDFKKAKEEWDDAEMETHGYFSGPRIKLKTREITKDDMQRVALKRAQYMIDNLVKTYQARPKDMSSKDEDALIEVMRKAKKMKEHLGSMFQGKENKGTRDK